MKIHLPNDLESSIEAVVYSGRFASVDDAMAEAARLLLRQVNQERPELKPTGTDAPPDPLFGMWREDADLLDEIVDHAMKNRREQPWRLSPGE
jgi:Arc/MetJ-type ribon-helix-helix transcriptional regulator